MLTPEQQELYRLSEEIRELKQRTVELRKKRDELSMALVLERERVANLQEQVEANEHRQRGGYTGGV